MFRPITLCAVLMCTLVLFSFRHPYHVAVTTLHYYKQTKQVNIDIKAFYHDMETAVNKFGSVEMDIKNHANARQRDSLVYAYVAANFTVSHDSRPLECLPVSVSFKDEYIFIKYLIKDAQPGKIAVSNSICYEIEKSQTNLVHLKSGELKESKKCVNPEKEVTFVLP